MIVMSRDKSARRHGRFQFDLWYFRYFRVGANFFSRLLP
jgi:hypothetical protein